MLATARSDEALHVRILPWRTIRAENLFHTDMLEAIPELVTVDRAGTRTKNCGVWFSGNASMTCSAVDSAVGWIVTLKWTTFRRSGRSTTEAKGMRNLAYGTVEPPLAHGQRPWVWGH